MKKILVLHGPNLNMLGLRETSLYGCTTLSTVDKHLQSMAEAAGHRVVTFQSNQESELINAIHQAYVDQVNHIIINPAAFTHTSIALRDALLAVEIPFIEVHISNIHARESFRHTSYFSDIAQGVICGLGVQSYSLALNAIIQANELENTHY